MIITLTPNPALDITYHLDELTVGAVHRVTTPATKPGGKGLNVARVLAQKGIPVTVMGFLGGQTGETIDRLLGEVPGAELISRAWTHFPHDTRKSIAIVSGDDATVLNEYGGSARWEDWAQLHLEVVTQASAGDVVAISGSLPPDSPAAALPAIISDLHAAGVRVIVDTSGPGLVAAAEAGADLLKPNHHELAEALGTTDLDAAVGQLLDLGAGAVVVSAGEAGMTLYPGRGHTPVAVKPPHIHGNPTGAGDASVAAWAATLADDVAWEAITHGDHEACRDAVIEAVATSAAAVAVPVAGEIDLDLYQELKTTLKESQC